jgi:hypothetical protein
VAVAASLLAPAASAQKPTSPYASVRGYVFDSLLTNTTLPGAEIMLSGPANRTAVSDNRGRFDVDSLPPGKYVVTFTHPSLNMLGYVPPDRTLELPAGVVTRIFLTTTAGRDIYTRMCPSVREDQTGAVVGVLTNVATQRPIGNGEVRVEWNESTISKELGLNRRSKAVRSTTDSLGRYKICGVPNDVGVLLRSRANGIDGPPLELMMADRSLAVRMLTMDVGDSTRRTTTNTVEKGTAVLRGTVKEEGGKPIHEAQVLVLGLPDGTQTSASGTFELANLPGGTHTVEIRAIGFDRRRQSVDFNPEKPAEINVSLRRMAVVLPEVAVNAKKTADIEEFDKRRQGGAGHFITEQDIERRNPLRTEDLFRTVPGFNVVPSGGFDYTVVSTRGADFNGQCSPDFYLDGAKIIVDPQIGGGIPVNPGEIYGIEVYSGAAETPAQYMTQNGCGAIVIWTKRGKFRR